MGDKWRDRGLVIDLNVVKEREGKKRSVYLCEAVAEGKRILK